MSCSALVTFTTSWGYSCWRRASRAGEREGREGGVMARAAWLSCRPDVAIFPLLVAQLAFNSTRVPHLTRTRVALAAAGR
jgi:hypothetical protein